VSDDWEEDMKKSSERFIKHWPTVRDSCGCDGDLVPVEGVDDDEKRRLDREFGVDYLAHSILHDRMVSIAARAQAPPHLYASFTIRLSRRTGTPTEWIKRRTSHRARTPNPDWTVQIYVDKSEGLAGYAAVRTSALLAYLDPPHGNCTVKDVKDGNRLMAVWWLWMRREGVELATFGEQRLRGPASPWHVPLDQPCMRCWHQIGCHVGGRALTSWQDRGWAVYDRVWMNASGSCSTKNCGCPSAYHPRIVDPARIAAVSRIPVCQACGWRLDPVLVVDGLHVCCEASV
jgi:hypothetical protein